PARRLAELRLPKPARLRPVRKRRLGSTAAEQGRLSARRWAEPRLRQPGRLRVIRGDDRQERTRQERTNAEGDVASRRDRRSGLGRVRLQDRKTRQGQGAQPNTWEQA